MLEIRKSDFVNVALLDVLPINRGINQKPGLLSIDTGYMNKTHFYLSNMQFVNSQPDISPGNGSLFEL